ncbi:hypothetical protein BVX97_05520 [bacterium E08(2017)]|nr:hypothetical protein BVX97_05520 [bacterium E08(2017)]
MDAPTETELPPLVPFATRTIQLRATFNRNVLTYVEDTQLAANIEAVLGEGPDATIVTTSATFEMTGLNSIDWNQEDMIACFITPKDPDVQVFMRQALKTAEAHQIQSSIDENLYKALTIFDAIQSIGIYYLPDPNQPFSFSDFSDRGVTDYLQYPRETLLRQSGDCDDLSVLYASLLEGAGIRTVMVTSPGHIFVAFELKGGKASVDSLGLSPDLLIEYKNSYYVPVETTLLGNPFISAWRMAATIVEKHRPNNEIGIIDIQKAWSKYKTVSLPNKESDVPMPDARVLADMLKRELDALNLKQVEKRLAIYKTWLKSDPKNIDILLFLARSYGEVGMFDMADNYANKALKLAPRNPQIHQALGNIAYMQNDYETAIKLFNKADKEKRNAPIQLNLSLAYLKDGKIVQARNSFKDAKSLDPGLVKDYPELQQLLE